MDIEFIENWNFGNSTKIYIYLILILEILNIT